MGIRITLANGKGFEVQPGVSLLDAAQHAGLALPHSCRTGRCGSCKTLATQPGRHLQGDDCLSSQERAAGWLLSCTDTVDADAQLDVEDQAELAQLRLLTLPARVQSIERPAPDVLRLRLRLPPNHGLRFLPGQYLDLIGPNGLRRAYSIANANPDDGLELQIRRVENGAMSRYLFDELQPNALLRLQGPRGSFRLGDDAGLRLVWLATGTGIAPFKAMLEQLAAQPRERWPAEIRLFWGNRRVSDFYWAPSAGELPLQFTPVCSREPGWAGAQGHVQDQALADALPDRVYACGNPAMIDAARARFLTRGLPSRHFHSDAFVASTT
jgi:CDP-4-dehydro-6-deoxyglucose reductase, E3